ncbi:MAG: permease, partial [bacterium]
MNLLLAGFDALADYLSAHVLTCLVPAFFIAGAIAVFISPESVVRYFGPRAPRPIAYGVASISGAILAVCSCTILPLFAGIRQRGAGLGPAVAFLYSGPAINVLAVLYTAQLLGLDLGIARAVGAISFSVVIGLIMALLFRREENIVQSQESEWTYGEDEVTHPLKRVIPFFAAQVLLLVAASSIGLVLTLGREQGSRWLVGFSGKPVPALFTLLLLIAVMIMAARWWNRELRAQWWAETWSLVWKIIPILLAGVFVAGILRELLPEEAVRRFVGGDSLTSNLFASVFGALMYFSTLTEV